MVVHNVPTSFRHIIGTGETIDAVVKEVKQQLAADKSKGLANLQYMIKRKPSGKGHYVVEVCLPAYWQEGLTYSQNASWYVKTVGGRYTRENTRAGTTGELVKGDLPIEVADYWLGNPNTITHVAKMWGIWLQHHIDTLETGKLSFKEIKHVHKFR